MRNRFQRGTGCYSCECCGRKTRYTGAQSIGTKLCPDCWELAGIYNVLQDGGDVSEYAAEIRARTANIVAKGGVLDSDAEKLIDAVGAAA